MAGFASTLFALSLLLPFVAILAGPELTHPVPFCRSTLLSFGFGRSLPIRFRNFGFNGRNPRGSQTASNFPCQFSKTVSIRGFVVKAPQQFGLLKNRKTAGRVKGKIPECKGVTRQILGITRVFWRKSGLPPPFFYAFSGRFGSDRVVAVEFKGLNGWGFGGIRTI